MMELENRCMQDKVWKWRQTCKGPSVLYSEFEKALEELKNKKATEPNGIPAKLLKALGSAGKRELFEICNEIYIRGEWPEDILESIIIPIEEKSGVQECVDFRTISLVSRASKIVLTSCGARHNKPRPLLPPTE